ncbi:MAG: hypothetical protein PF447_09210 [Spirochaetaceae bacterium]|jgi:hypothetical protein|nr:hypothetical protein [Spirochaetaceae bacterium]
MNKKKQVLLLLLVLSMSLGAQNPSWVDLFTLGKMAEISGTDNYLGVGSSINNQDEADQNAKVDFARNVETRVDSTMEEVYQEEQGEGETTLSMSLEIKTEMSLKGISITERYFNEESQTYYSMIKVNRADYLTILENNIQEEIALKDADLDRQRQELEQDSIAQEQENLRHQQEMREMQIREEKRQLRIARYGDFIEREPYPGLISFENAEVYPTRQHLSASLSLSDDFSLRRLGYSFSIAEIFQASTTHLVDNTWTSELDDALIYSDLDAKLALLNHAGDIIKFSAALGARGYILTPFPLQNDSEISGTLYGVANVSVPQLYYSDFSVYAGLDKVALGVCWYPTFPWLGESLGLIVESSYDFRKELRYGRTENYWRLQTGLQFKPADAACTRITWEDNFKTFVLALDINLGKGR